MPNTRLPDSEYIVVPSLRFGGQWAILEIELGRDFPAADSFTVAALVDDLEYVKAQRIAAALNAFEEPPTIEIGPPDEAGDLGEFPPSQGVYDDPTEYLRRTYLNEAPFGDMVGA